MQWYNIIIIKFIGLYIIFIHNNYNYNIYPLIFIPGPLFSCAPLQFSSESLSSASSSAGRDCASHSVLEIRVITYYCSVTSCSIVHIKHYSHLCRLGWCLFRWCCCFFIISQLRLHCTDISICNTTEMRGCTAIVLGQAW